jgi:hypothetical protein
MLKEALEYLVGLARNGQTQALTETVTLPSPFDGEDAKYNYKVEPTEYGRQLMDVIKPFQPDVLSVTTLTSFIQAIGGIGQIGEASDERIIHVEEPTRVVVKTADSDAYGRRNVLLKAEYTGPTFNFDQYYEDLTRFVIALQTSFAPNDELAYVTRLASNLKAGNSVQSTDDGFAQLLTIKTGEITTAEVKVNPRISLRPIRTFPEIEPVSSEFLIRFRQQGNAVPSIALFNCDGNRWRSDTMRAVSEYLKDVVNDIPVLA